MITPETQTKPVKKVAPLMVGKTIKSVDDTACNCLSIEFTDGTELLLECENLAPIGLMGIIGYIRKNDEKV